MCKVSVLVPVYNVEMYLQQCLDSLLAQTLRDIEIICIDDGSTDTSGRILDEYVDKDARIRVIHQPNGGYGKAMNTGLHTATGEYIGVVESDDFASPEMLLKLHETAEHHKAQVFKSNYYRYWTTPKERNKKEPLLKNLPCEKVIHPWAYPRLFRIQPSIWSGIYRRDFLEQYQIEFLETPGAAYQDTSFTFKVFASAERVVLLDGAYLHYRQDNGNSSVHSAEKAEYVRTEYIEISRFLDTEDKYRILYKTRNAAMFHTYLWNYVRLKPELCPAFLQAMQHDFRDLQSRGQLSSSDFTGSDAAMLEQILDNAELFRKKEQILMPLRGKIPQRVYRALLIGCTAGITAMIRAVVKRLLRK